MPRRMLVSLCVIVCAVAAGRAVPVAQAPRSGAATAQSARSATAAPATRDTPPRLVVILVVDQMRADYVAHFSRHWTGGLKRLMDEGASFTQASYGHMTTVTCVGHTSIATGSLPRTHGIIANDLYDREAGRTSNCTQDTDATIVSYGDPMKGPGTSTRKALVPALPDELRAQLQAAPRIVTLSMKDYTATMLAGRRADAALWGVPGTIASSSAFSAAPVPWVQAFVKANPIDGDYGKSWTKLLPDSAYVFPDDSEGERGYGKWTRTFPHVLEGAAGKPDGQFYSEWEASPFSDEYLGKLAQTAIDALKLGQEDRTDYLAISFSTLDLVGHQYGPRSQEAQDVLARLDRTIGALLTKLDRTVGRANYTLALTGDHGVSPIPEQMAALGLNGGRIVTPDMFARIDKALEPFLGPGKKASRLVYNDVFLEPGVYEKLRANPDAMRAAVEAVRSTPGVSRVFTSDQLANMTGAPTDEVARAVLNNFHPGRSGDFTVIPAPYFQFANNAKAGGTTHGSPYWYDRRVPLFLLGKHIKPGSYSAASSPIDIAPTLAFLCGVTLPAADGRVLTEALRSMKNGE